MATAEYITIHVRNYDVHRFVCSRYFFLTNLCKVNDFVWIFVEMFWFLCDSLGPTVLVGSLCDGRGYCVMF